jgi:glycosyltransferase involved in cell wall biosynthesis
MKVLLSAYACEPDKGSEPGVGWNLARALAAHCDVWVLTRQSNRIAIERELVEHPVPRLRFAYFDLPRSLRFWKVGQRGVRLYYFLWQVGALAVARRLHRAVGFDLVHHVTFVKFWTPSFLPLLGIPFIWGPVGGADVTPWRFLPSLGVRGCLYELARFAAVAAADLDPLLRMTARRSALALATTPATAARLSRMGARRVEQMPEVALTERERAAFGPPRQTSATVIRILSIGRLLPFKGIHLALRAFARAGLADAEYWLVGDGPDRRRLERLARRLAIDSRVQLLGSVPRAEALELLKRCDLVLHTSLHESGGWVCVEAMAAGKPVICLDLAGPATQVTSSTGLRIPARTPKATVAAIAAALSSLVGDPDLRRSMGVAGQSRIREGFDWEARAARLVDRYATVLPSTSASESAIRGVTLVRSLEVFRTDREAGA